VGDREGVEGDVVENVVPWHFSGWLENENGGGG